MERAGGGGEPGSAEYHAARSGLALARAFLKIKSDKSDKSDKTNNDAGSFAVRPAAERSDKSDKPETCIKRVARHPSLRLFRGFLLLDTNRASRRACQTSAVGTSYPCGRRRGPFWYPHSSWLNSALHFWTSPNTWVHARPNS